MTLQRKPFHLALPVDDLEAARDFYCDVLACPAGRTSERWIDLNFFGHQLTLHRVDDVEQALDGTNAVDGDDVPVRHFGVVLDRPEWESLAERLRSANCTFVIPPRIRFQGQVGEQATMFLLDPAGNALEFKSFNDPTQLFAT